MVYGFRNRRYRKRKYKKQTPKYLKKRYGVNRSFVYRLRRVEKTLSKKRINMYCRTAHGDLSTNLTAPLTQVRLCHFVDDIKCLGTDPNDMLGSKVLYKSVSIKMDVRLENLSETEEETINVEYYIVRLTDHGAPLIDRSTGYLTGLVDGLHYYRFDGNTVGDTGAGEVGVGAIGYTYLNTQFFKILKHDRFMLTNYGQSLGTSTAQNLDGTNYRRNFNIKINQVIRAPPNNSADQSWKALVCPHDPSQNYFILYFCDNSALDSEFPRSTTFCLKKFEKLDN